MKDPLFLPSFVRIRVWFGMYAAEGRKRSANDRTVIEHQAEYLPTIVAAKALTGRVLPGSSMLLTEEARLPRGWGLIARSLQIAYLIQAAREATDSSTVRSNDDSLKIQDQHKDPKRPTQCHCPEPMSTSRFKPVRLSSLIRSLSSSANSSSSKRADDVSKMHELAVYGVSKFTGIRRQVEIPYVLPSFARVTAVNNSPASQAQAKS
jgi:hypothetical protein